MRVIDRLEDANLDKDTVLTIGAYDGVHRGHQVLLRQVIARAQETNHLSGLVTFYPHPRAVLHSSKGVQYLTTPGEKAVLLEQLGLDIMVLLAFTPEMAATPAREFMRTLVDRLRMRELWTGEDFALGRHREGDVETLRQLGDEFGYMLHVIPTVRGDSEPISSSGIRDLLNKGAVAEAARLLGRYYSLSGEVVTGMARGRDLGFPTANLAVRAERAIPGDGVYAVFALIGGTRCPAVANIGTRPTFGEGMRVVEVHLIGERCDLYGQDLTIEFVKRLRSEKQFPSAPELVEQIQKDVREAQVILREVQFMLEPRRFEEIEHTADVAIRAYGHTLADLYANAAYGMFQLACGAEKIAVTGPARHVELTARDREALLVNWLNELLYMQDEHHEVYTEFTITELSDTRLKALVRGGPPTCIYKHIKAATFHGLEIEENANGFVATIVFDV